MPLSFNRLADQSPSQEWFLPDRWGGVEATDMHAITSESLNSTEVCVWPREAPVDEHETDLVARLQAGDEGAFRAIVDRYSSRIYRACYGILRSREDADEIGQEVFAKVYFSIKGFEGRSSLYAWIYRIAVNECYGF